MLPNLSSLDISKCHPINNTSTIDTPLDEESILALFRLNIAQSQFDNSVGQLECSICFEKLGEPAPRRDPTQFPLPAHGVPQYVRVCDNSHYLHGACQLFSYQVKKRGGNSENEARKCAYGCGAQMTQQTMIDLSIIPNPRSTLTMLTSTELTRQAEEMRRMAVETRGAERTEARRARQEAARLEMQQRTADRRERQRVERENAQRRRLEERNIISELKTQANVEREKIRLVSMEVTNPFVDLCTQLSSSLQTFIDANKESEEQWNLYNEQLESFEGSGRAPQQPGSFPRLTFHIVSRFRNTQYACMKLIEYFSMSMEYRLRPGLFKVKEICSAIGNILRNIDSTAMFPQPSSSDRTYELVDRFTRLPSWRSINENTCSEFIDMQERSKRIIDLFHSEIYPLADKDLEVVSRPNMQLSEQDPTGFDSMYEKAVESIEFVTNLRTQYQNSGNYVDELE